MKNILILTIVLLCFKTFSQTKDKKYKYAIVPVQFGFLDEENKYQLNVLTRVRLKEIGFEVFMDEEEKKPKELELDRCLALNANVKRNKGLLTTTLIFELKNCFGKLIYESQGESRLKSYKDAYQEALNRALDKFETDAVLYLKTSNEKKANKVTEVVTFDNKSKEKLPFEKRANPYQLYGQIYWLLQEGNNYIIYTDKGETIYANLEYVGQGSFSFDSADIDGAAFFDANGNLIVEYLAKDKNAVQKLIFKKQ